MELSEKKKVCYRKSMIHFFECSKRLFNVNVTFCMSVGVPQWTVRVMSVVPSLRVARNAVTHILLTRPEVKLEESGFTHRYWPPESTKNISSTVSLLLVSSDGLKGKKSTGSETGEIYDSVYCYNTVEIFLKLFLIRKENTSGIVVFSRNSYVFTHVEFWKSLTMNFSF